VNRRSLLWILAGLTIVLLGAAVFEPSGVVRGTIRGFFGHELFYHGKPTSSWRRALADRDPKTQSEAVQTLRSGGAEAVPVLIELLTDTHADWSSTEARWRAAQILGDLGAEAKPALSALLAAAHDQDPHVRSVVLAVLAEMEVPAADGLPLFLEALGTEDKVAACRGLARLGARAKSAIPELRKLLGDPRGEVRWNAARALGKIGPEAAVAVPNLITQLQDEDGLVREHAAEALGEIGESAASAVPALSLKDREPRVRRDAVRALGQIGLSARSALPAIRELLKDEDARVREAAAKAVYRLEPPGAGASVPGSGAADAGAILPVGRPSQADGPAPHMHAGRSETAWEGRPTRLC
jgi:HEAT repeat protein